MCLNFLLSAINDEKRSLQKFFRKIAKKKSTKKLLLKIARPKRCCGNY